MDCVLPAAIDKAIYFAIILRNDNECRIFDFDMNDFFECTINELKKSDKGWPHYLLGVVDQLKKNGYIFTRFNCVFGGNILIGAGLSSSAALEYGLAFGLNHIFSLGIDKL